MLFKVFITAGMLMFVLLLNDDVSVRIQQGLSLLGITKCSPSCTTTLFQQSLHDLSTEIPKSSLTTVLQLSQTLLISVDTIINHILYQCLDILITAAINHPQWYFILLFLFLIHLAVQEITHQEICYCCHSVCFLLLFYYIRHIIIYFIFTSQLFNIIHMQAEQPHPLPKGNYYTIVCKAHQKSVRVQQTDKKNHYKSKLISSNINPQDNNQIFMVQRMDTYGTNYEIVCCASDYVFEEHNQQVILNDGKQSKHQLFTLTPVASTKLHQYYAIRPAYDPSHAMALQDSLRIATYDPNSVIQHFRFEEVNNTTIQNSCLLVNNYCGKAIDVPAGSEKEGDRIIIWDRNKRWNQRWIFQKVGSVHLIKSVMNGLCLDIAGESRDSGAKIVQWPQTGGTNQLWLIQPAGEDLFKIWSYHEPSLCLGLRKQEGSDGTYLQVTKYDNPTTYWRIEGSMPK